MKLEFSRHILEKYRSVSDIRVVPFVGIDKRMFEMDRQI